MAQSWFHDGLDLSLNLSPQIRSHYIETFARTALSVPEFPQRTSSWSWAVDTLAHTDIPSLEFRANFDVIACVSACTKSLWKNERERTLYLFLAYAFFLDSVIDSIRRAGRIWIYKVEFLTGAGSLIPNKGESTCSGYRFRANAFALVWMRNKRSQTKDLADSSRTKTTLFVKESSILNTLLSVCVLTNAFAYGWM